MEPITIYLALMFVVGVALTLMLNRIISRAEAWRCKRVKHFKRYQPINSATPVDDPKKAALEKALDSIANRFSIIRKLFIIIFLLIWLMAMVLPFMNYLPAVLVSTMLACVTVIIGIAAKPFVENLICGVVISFSRPFRTGDTVIVDDHYGTIEDITMTHTLVKVWNWRRYIIPNSRMISKEFVNCTIGDAYQWMHVEFWVSYAADIALVRELAIKAALESPHNANYEEPSFWVMEMGQQGVRCWIAAWADSPTDAWQLGHDIRTRLIVEFNRSGIQSHQYRIMGSASQDWNGTMNDANDVRQT